MNFMKKLTLFSILLLASVFVCKAQGTQRKLQMLTDSATVTKSVADQYMEYYMRFSWDSLSMIIADDMIFTDVTSELGVGWKPLIAGKDSVLAFFRNNWVGFKGFFEPKYSQKKYSGNHAIYVMDLVFEFFVDSKQQNTLKVSVPIVTVLTVRKGKVEKHQDFADYIDYNQQILDGMKKIRAKKQ